jgi:hypothetical protein
LPFLILINSANKNKFFYDTTGTLNKAKDYIDFYSDILHELGHAHCQFYVSQSNDLMYWLEKPDSLASIDRNIKFNIDNRNGGDWVVAHSVDLTPYAYFNSCSYNIPMAKQATSCRTIANSLLGRNAISNKVTAYPNPTQGNVTLDFTTQDYWAVQLYNQQGVLVKELRNEHFKSVELNTEDFAKGVYIIIATNGIETINTKIICE